MVAIVARIFLPLIRAIFKMVRLKLLTIDPFIEIKSHDLILNFRWADGLKSEGKNGKLENFNHPFVQACSMFLGEFMCLVTFKIIYWILRSRRVSLDKKKSLAGIMFVLSSYFIYPTGRLRRHQWIGKGKS